MKEYTVEELTSRVRNVIDQNMTSEQMEGFSDVDTLSLDQVIYENLCKGARLMESSAPYDMLGSGVAIPTDGIAVDDLYESVKLVCKVLALPSDFMRFVAFRMSDWRMSVTEAISDRDPYYAMQRSVVSAVRGNPQRPIVAIVPVGSESLQLEAYTTSADSEVVTAQYIPQPAVKTENGISSILLCERLVDSIVMAIAYLTASSLNAIGQAQIFLSLAKNLAGIQSSETNSANQEQQ